MCLSEAGVGGFVRIDFCSRREAAEFVETGLAQRSGLVSRQILVLLVDTLQVVDVENVADCMRQSTASIHRRSILSRLDLNRRAHHHIP